jgi:fibronectin-binding autotransporter adhesin
VGAGGTGLYVLAPIGAKYINMFVGAPGGDAGYTYSGSGLGGIGGGSVYFECAGTLNVSSQFTSNGTNGTETTDYGASGGDGGGGGSYNNGTAGATGNHTGPWGGGGGGGNFVFCAKVFGSVSPTFTLTGGTSSGSGGVGGAGSSAAIINTEFS